MIAGPGRAGLGPGPGRAAGCLQVFRLPFRLPWRLPASVSAARSSVAVLSTRIMTRMRLSRVRAKVDSECQPECHRAMVLPLHPLLRRPYAVHRAAGHTDWQARRPWQPPRSLRALARDFYITSICGRSRSWSPVTVAGSSASPRAPLPDRHGDPGGY